jgi:hypothetical protein
MTQEIITNICSKPFFNTDLEKVRNIITGNPLLNRQYLARLICKEFGWVAANGRLKEMSCKVALLKLHRRGLLELPASTRKPTSAKKKFIISSLSDPCFPIAKSVQEIGAIELVPVQTKSPSRLWNELIERYHYLGYTSLPGAQIRYLIYCRDGLMGAISFSASAWKTAPRDEWIGWDRIQREKNLHLIVNNSRYLIAPWVTVPHAASKILSLCAKRLRADWKVRYAYEPVLLETFVEKGRFKGTCYKAANWVCVGQTQGRGKKDVHHERLLPIKDIWMYPLVKDFREQLKDSA